MEDELLSKSLVDTQQPANNIRISNDRGFNDGSASGVTAVLVLSSFVTACSAFAGGFVVSVICIYIYIYIYIACGELTCCKRDGIRRDNNNMSYMIHDTSCACIGVLQHMWDSMN